MTSDSVSDLGERQIWLRAFYGFDPEGAGYIGFTHAADREAILNEMNDGDLVLIYGAVEDLTDQNLRAQALGFLEMSRESCVDRDRMSETSLDWKIQHGFEHRWTNGIMVRRAWRVRNRVNIGTIAPEAYQSKNRFVRTTRAILLNPEERVRALSHPVYQTNVFGEQPVDAARMFSGPMLEALKPSRGIPPVFGARTAEYQDGENEVYLMVLTAKANLLLGERARPTDHTLAKVGRSNDPVRRLSELNCGFPETSTVRWKLAYKQAFAEGASAHDHETKLKALFATQFKSEGGEFFSGSKDDIIRAFQTYCVDVLPRILGAAGRARGV